MNEENNNTRPEKYGPPEILPQEIHYNEQEDFIGEGNYGVVYGGRCRGTSVAVKVPRKQDLSEKEIEDFRKEVKIMSQIFHPNVVLFMGACTNPGSIMLVTEKMCNDLDHFLNSPEAKKLSVDARLKMAKDAAKGMSWLHGINNIIHRDLKPANLLLDQNRTVKVTDFGLSEILKGNFMKEKVPKGTALWMPPEVLKTAEFDKSVDVYAFGMILWQIFYLTEPFQEYDDWDIFYEVICIQNKRPPIDQTCPPSLAKLISDCWSADRLQRPSFSEVVYRLDQVIVDVVIQDNAGRNFWNKFYLTPKQELQEIVGWRDFTQSLCVSTGVNPATRAQFEILYPYLASSSEGHNGKVTLHSFNCAINWFGPNFFQKVNSLEKIKQLTSKLWFHGTIDQNEANGRLMTQPSGAFLVRLSKTLAEFPFTLSFNYGGCQRHLRVKKDKDFASEEDVFIVAGHDNAYFSLIELIEGISSHLSLKKPCPKKPAEDMYSGKVDDLLVGNK